MDPTANDPTPQFSSDPHTLLRESMVSLKEVSSWSAPVCEILILFFILLFSLFMYLLFSFSPFLPSCLFFPLSQSLITGSLLVHFDVSLCVHVYSFLCHIIIYLKITNHMTYMYMQHNYYFEDGVYMLCH